MILGVYAVEYLMFLVYLVEKDKRPVPFEVILYSILGIFWPVYAFFLVIAFILGLIHDLKRSISYVDRLANPVNNTSDQEPKDVRSTEPSHLGKPTEE